MSRLSNAFSAVSQLANVIVLNGEPNESISGRSYREPWPRAMRVINAIFFWQSNHCRGAYMRDREWAEQYLQSQPDRKP